MQHLPLFLLQVHPNNSNMIFKKHKPMRPKWMERNHGNNILENWKYRGGGLTVDWADPRKLNPNPAKGRAERQSDLHTEPTQYLKIDIPGT